MANIENLKPVRNEEEARELGKKGGKRSGEVRREKANMKKTLEMLLDVVPDIEGNKDKQTWKELATLGLIKGAVQGNSQNYKTIMETIGELNPEGNVSPTLKIEINDNSKLEKTLYEENQHK